MKDFATDGNGVDPDHLDPMRLLFAAAAVRDGGDPGEYFSVQLSSAQSDLWGYIKPPTESTSPNRATRRENAVPIK